MLEPWIIEEIRRREREQQEDHREQPRIEAPRYYEDTEASPPPAPADDRGVIIIEI